MTLYSSLTTRFTRLSRLTLFATSALLFGCSGQEGSPGGGSGEPGQEGTGSTGDGSGSDNPGADGSGGNGSSAGGAGNTGSGGNGSGNPGGTSVCGVEWGPNAANIPQVGEPGFDRSADPGVHPTFSSDPDLTRCEDYVYTPTEAGDHDLDPGIVAVNYDVTGADDLRAVLSSHLSELQAGHGLALYLRGGTELGDADLDFLQKLNLEGDGLGLDNLDTLHVYNLRSLRGGVESTLEEERSYGIPEPFLWRNGWHAPDSEIMKGTGWVKHIVMDDLEEIQAGTFCDTMFESISFKGVKVVREMGFGFSPRGKLTYIYMPSLEEVEQHAFRRRQRVTKYNLPRLKVAGRFAFDDNTQIQFFNMPSLINPDTGDNEDTRNTFNDPRDLIAFNFPSMEFTGLAMIGGTNETTTVFRFPSMINFEGGSLQGHTNLKFVWAPNAVRIGPNMFVGNVSLSEVYAPKVEDVGYTSFKGCTGLSYLELPSAKIVRINAFEGATSLEEVHLPVIENIQNEVFLDLPNLKRVYLGETPPEQGTDVFTGTSPELVIYHQGDDAAWNGWRPVGNDTATVVHE